MSFINIHVKRYLLSFLFMTTAACMLHKAACAQQKAIDSVSALLMKHTAEDSGKVDLMIKLSAFYQSGNLSKAEYHATRALELAEKIHDNRVACAAMSQLGSVLTWQRLSSKALNVYFRERE